MPSPTTSTASPEEPQKQQKCSTNLRSQGLCTRKFLPPLKKTHNSNNNKRHVKTVRKKKKNIWSKFILKNIVLCYPLTHLSPFNDEVRPVTRIVLFYQPNFFRSNFNATIGVFTNPGVFPSHLFFFGGSPKPLNSEFYFGAFSAPKICTVLEGCLAKLIRDLGWYVFLSRQKLEKGADEVYSCWMFSLEDVCFWLWMIF